MSARDPVMSSLEQSMYTPAKKPRHQPPIATHQKQNETSLDEHVKAVRDGEGIPAPML